MPGASRGTTRRATPPGSSKDASHLPLRRAGTRTRRDSDRSAKDRGTSFARERRNHPDLLVNGCTERETRALRVATGGAFLDDQRALDDLGGDAVTRARILASSAALSSDSTKAVGHMAPPSRSHRERDMSSPMSEEAELQGLNTAMTIKQVAPTAVLITITGSDVGELGDAPFKELEQRLAQGPFSLFIDARRTKGASVDVSNVWARWLRVHRDALLRIHMLTGSRFVQMT